MKNNLIFSIIAMILFSFSVQAFAADGPIISINQGANDIISGTGEIGIGSTSPQNVVFTIKNIGNAELKISGIAISGANATDFTVISGGGASTIAAGASASFTVNFTRGAGGYREGTITVNSNGTNTPTYNFNINTKLHPSLSWSNPAAINYGTLLSATQLNAGVAGGIAGQFTYNPAIDTKLSAGQSQELTVTFKPSDLNSYSIASKKVYIEVIPITSVLTWDNPADITYGTALTSTILNAVAKNGTEIISGAFVYTPAAGTKLNVGDNQKLDVAFTPNDANYSTAAKSVYINVKKASSIITWSNPNPIAYGTALSASHLNATANVAGSFLYTPALGTVLEIGNRTLKVDFTPTDGANYLPSTKQVEIIVGSAVAPLLQAHRILLQSKAGYGYDLIFGNKFSIEWTRGEGMFCTVFVSESLTTLPQAVSGTSYTANSVYKQGAQIGSSGWYCVYDGTGTSVTVTGLTPSKEYNIMVLEYNKVNTFKSYLLDESIYNPVALKTMVSVTENIMASNFVSPNNDGKNDVWTVGRLDELADYELHIFNNLGEEVYYAKPYNNDWDLTYNGEKVLAGTYYYIFKKDESYVKGYFTVVKD